MCVDLLEARTKGRQVSASERARCSGMRVYFRRKILPGAPV